MWISAESAALLQRLADEQGQPKNRIIELALAAYATSEPTSTDTSNLLDWRTDLSNRVLVLESRLQALEAERGVRTGAVGIEAVDVACEPVDVAVKIEPAANSTINQSTDDWESAVIKHYNNGVRGWETIAKMTYAAGYQTKNGTMRDGSHVSKVIKATGLKD